MLPMNASSNVGIATDQLVAVPEDLPEARFQQGFKLRPLAYSPSPDGWVRFCQRVQLLMMQREKVSCH